MEGRHAVARHDGFLWAIMLAVPRRWQGFALDRAASERALLASEDEVWPLNDASGREPIPQTSLCFGVMKMWRSGEWAGSERNPRVHAWQPEQPSATRGAFDASMTRLHAQCSGDTTMCSAAFPVAKGRAGDTSLSKRHPRHIRARRIQPLKSLARRAVRSEHFRRGLRGLHSPLSAATTPPRESGPWRC